MLNDFGEFFVDESSRFFGYVLNGKGAVTVDPSVALREAGSYGNSIGIVVLSDSSGGRRRRESGAACSGFKLVVSLGEPIDSCVCRKVQRCSWSPALFCPGLKVDRFHNPPRFRDMQGCLLYRCITRRHILVSTY